MLPDSAVEFKNLLLREVPTLRVTGISGVERWEDYSLAVSVPYKDAAEVREITSANIDVRLVGQSAVSLHARGVDWFLIASTESIPSSIAALVLAEFFVETSEVQDLSDAEERHDRLIWELNFGALPEARSVAVAHIQGLLDARVRALLSEPTRSTSVWLSEGANDLGSNKEAYRAAGRLSSAALSFLISIVGTNLDADLGALVSSAEETARKAKRSAARGGLST